MRVVRANEFVGRPLTADDDVFRHVCAGCRRLDASAVFFSRFETLVHDEMVLFQTIIERRLYYTVMQTGF